MFEEKYMKRAIELAKKGTGWVNPNPLVGAVVVRNGKIIGEGYHEKYGEKHAEVNAIESASESTLDSTIYVTLEPCCHEGKQPPCVKAIIKAGIKKVVIGSKDSNPLVAGKGVSILRENGIEVKEGFLEKECDKINEIFFYFITHKKPFVIMKYAMTLDGKIATSSGNSKWISNQESRHHVHEDRSKFSSIMVGVETVIKDDPELTSRIEGGRNPKRIVCDTNLRTPLTSKIVTTAREVTTIIATSKTDENLHKLYIDKGCKVIVVPKKEEHISLKVLIYYLGEMGIDSIFLEGGGTLNWSAIKEGIVNKVQAYIAPKIVGGIHSKGPVGGEGFLFLKDAINLKNMTIKQYGEDFLIEGDVVDVHRDC